MLVNPSLSRSQEANSLESLFAVTDSDLLRQRRIPPDGMVLCDDSSQEARHANACCSTTTSACRRALQFAVGGRVYPSDAHWVNLTERFREAVIRQRCLQVSLWRTHLYGE